MNIIIAGGDKSGQNLIRLFSEKSRYKVTLIETNAKRCEWISEGYPEVHIVWGDATYPDVLRSADADKADVFIAVIGDDKSNILAAKAAKKMGIQKVMVKVTGSEYQDLAELMEFDDVLDPAEAISAEFITRLQGVDFVNLIQDLHLDVEFTKSKVNEIEDAKGIEDMKVDDFSGLFADKVYPMFVIRDGKYLMPNEIETLRGDDTVIFLKKPVKKSRAGGLLGLK